MTNPTNKRTPQVARISSEARPVTLCDPLKKNPTDCGAIIVIQTSVVLCGFLGFVIPLIIVPVIYKQTEGSISLAAKGLTALLMFIGCCIGLCAGMLLGLIIYKNFCTDKTLNQQMISIEAPDNDSVDEQTQLSVNSNHFGMVLS